MDGGKVVEKLRVTQKVEEKRDFQETRKDIPCIASMDPAEAAELIAENPAYGTVICRCEKVTEGEIIDAIRRPLGARSGRDQTAHKGRHGRCQAGFCSTEGDGDPGKGAWNPTGRGHEGRRGLPEC